MVITPSRLPSPVWNNESLLGSEENTMSDDTTSPQNVEAPEVQPDRAASANREANLDAILDVPVTLTLEIGRTTLPIKELLSLGQGSVIELERLIGEPHDVLVNGTLIAQGEVVVVGDQFGIRFTDIVSPAERVQRLK
ncbi:MAG: flagellar motor switch protein FliN [Gammaproteobacteria bacterium]|nr:flagellar motor switch protein FliN [Gammaproteobacteria bacterium]